MESVLQDDELWRRAFTANAGLFFDTFSDPLGGDDSGAALADLASSPAATTHNNRNTNKTDGNTSDLLPMHSLEFVAPVARQQQQHHQPTFRVQVSGRTNLLAPPLSIQPQPPPPLQQQQRIVAPVGMKETPLLRNAAAMIEPPAATPTQEPASDQGLTNQRGGESFARKRDRAKLLRQQMNDGLDNLHEALVEISKSGANPSACATTSLIPTRGPRRAAVVASSAGLVRDLISTCVALRADNASLSDQLSSALATAAMLQQQQQPQPQAGGGSTAAPLAVATGRGGGGGGEQLAAARKKREDRAAHEQAGDSAAATRAGEMSARVFGQLLSLSVLGFLGPQSLTEGRKVSREWRDKCTWDCNWKNLCVSRWRLGPEQRHAEVWRVPNKPSSGKNDTVTRAVVSPPLPPSWRSIYGRLHGDLRVPTGALSPSHLVIGKGIQEGVAIWIALNRRSNGMTGRSVIGHGSAGFRTTEVIELRAVVQRVEEGQAVRVHPRTLAVRQVTGLRAFYGGNSSDSGFAGNDRVITTTGIFPPVSQGEDMFSPRFTVNTGPAVKNNSGGRSGGCGSMAGLPGDGLGMGSWLGTAASPAAQAATPPLALHEYATVDFFIEAAGCPTEADFLRLEACVDVTVSSAAAATAAPGGGGRGASAVTMGGGDASLQLPKTISVGLTEVTPPPPSAFGLHVMGVEMGRPLKRRV